ncbi:cysteine desulfurase family protein [Desertivirga brevis]|uniref:cysteine desulfurase family protein n=1 Tax=Desertivirga brevis TaxID=2810310 RepID=UPI001A9756AA|nr:cysteine desulfurase family protein [Pedobacter sp. SYSU D00873]
MRIYLDNAATTIIDQEVLDAMLPYFRNNYGNASSSHHLGREARRAVEESRRKIAELINAEPSEIVFTSGGTEGDNTAIFSSIRSHKIRHAITSRLEHHAVLNPLKALEQQGRIKLDFVDHDKQGSISLEHLQSLLMGSEPAFVSIMHGNNEIGNLNPIQEIASLCHDFDAIFHSDTVQTIGHKILDVKELNCNFLVASAHKFHGPKGAGFLYKNKRLGIDPFVYGGAQESRQRAGTENTAGIVGLAKALEISYRERGKSAAHFRILKDYTIKELSRAFPKVRFNGNSADEQSSLDSILNFSLPHSSFDILAALDNRGIFISAGSACTSGSATSYVLAELGVSSGKTFRISFSKYNTVVEIDYLVSVLEKIYEGELKTKGEYAAARR